MFVTDIGIDLGTSYVLMYVRNKGVVLREPTVVAVNRQTKQLIAIGSEAREMLGRAPEHIVAIRPLTQGVISDFTLTEKMLKYYISKAKGKKFRKPNVSICVPSGVSEVERRAVEDAAYQAGAGKVRIMDEPIAAAIGAGIDINQPYGRMIIDIGGGTTDVAVISLGGLVLNTSIKIAGDDFDNALMKYMRWKYNLLIGEMTAEKVKIDIGCICERPEIVYMDIKGRCLVTGLPKTVEISSDETITPLSDVAVKIVDAAYNVLERTPPELAADISQEGIVVTGGGSLLYGMDQLIEKKLGVPVKLAKDPLSSVVMGLQYRSKN